MNVVLSEILRSQKVVDDNGKIVRLNSSIDKEEIGFISGLLKEKRSVKSIEIGCAMGISSLTICEAITKNSVDAHHVIIDPFQKAEWQNIGINNLKKANFHNYTLHEKRSEYILPQLAESGQRFDFAFIDGWHTFDHTLVDFFYVNRMLTVGGILVIDDLHMPSINKAIRFIHTFPHYKYINSVRLKKSKARRVAGMAQSAVKPLAKMFGNKIATEVFSPNILHTNNALGLNASMIAFEKTSEDARPWNWHAAF